MSVDLEDFLDTEVFDDKDHLIGSFECFWMDDDDQPQLVGIKLNSSADRTFLVPVVLITPDERQSCIRIQAPERQISYAPTLDCNEELNETTEEQAYNHFSLTAPSGPHELHSTRSHSK